jgi:uncharacterized membrane protein YfcA
MYPISEKSFLMILAGTLVLAGIRLLFTPHLDEQESKRPALVVALVIGGFLGLVSGLVGIGGGIFLSPLMLNLKWGKPKEVAATASAFIWLNSIAGLVGQFVKGSEVGDIRPYWPLFVAVLFGGQIGSWIGTHSKVSQGLIQRGTAVLILFISLRLIFKII